MFMMHLMILVTITIEHLIYKFAVRLESQVLVALHVFPRFHKGKSLT
jgi:hypothetical protein